jgi:hypothetical protein
MFVCEALRRLGFVARLTPMLPPQAFQNVFQKNTSDFFSLFLFTSSTMILGMNKS